MSFKKTGETARKLSDKIFLWGMQSADPSVLEIKDILHIGLSEYLDVGSASAKPEGNG